MADDSRSLASAAPDAASRLARLSIGVLRNPGSGANLRSGKAMRDELAAHPQVPCRDVTGPADIVVALTEMAARGVDTIAISGGDGTVSAVLDAVYGRSLFPQRPLIAVLRGGTANMTARCIGMRGPQHLALRSLIGAGTGAGERLKVTRRPVMSVDRGDGHAAIHGMFFGAAAISQGIDYCKRRVHALGLRGEIGPAVTMLRFVLAMARGDRAIVSPVSMSVAVDDEPPVRFDCEIVHVTTLEQLVLGLRPWWGREPGPLHYASVRANPRHWIRALPGVLRGRPSRLVTEANGYTSRNAHRLSVGLDSPFFVDGELYTPQARTPLTLTDAGPAEFVTMR